MDRPSVFVCAHRTNPAFVRIDSRAQTPLFLVQPHVVNKKKSNRRIPGKKNRRGIAAAAIVVRRVPRSAALFNRHERQILWPGVIRCWANQLVVNSLFHHMRGPARCPRDHE